MAATTTTLRTSFEDAVEIAEEQGVTKTHVVRDAKTKLWTAIVSRFNGARTSTAKGLTYEDAVVRAFMDAGVTW